MSYTLHMTNRAESDIAEAAAYITHALLNPQAADSLLDTVESSLFTLTEYPFRHALADDPVLQAYGIRFIQIERYLAFYTVSQDEICFSYSLIFIEIRMRMQCTIYFQL